MFYAVLLVIVWTLLITTNFAKNPDQRYVNVGKLCDPAVDTTWHAVEDDFTKFVFCSPTKNKFIENSCPQLNGMPQYFDEITKRCFTPRSRNKRTPGIPKSSGVGEPCIFNTDCMDNMYCPSGRCLCNPGYVGALNSIQSCIRALNPGQPGCQSDVQCDGGWPGATCVNNVCTCPSSSDGIDGRPVTTQDGAVCVIQPAGAGLTNAICPLPEGLSSATIDFADILRSADPAANRIFCVTSGPTSATQSCVLPAAVPPTTDIAPDIYDCIPFVGTSGVCCPSRAMVCIQPKKPGAGALSRGTRYWYNSVTNLCEPFAWALDGATAPADTNSNNFRTIEHCYSYCRGTCQRGNPKLNPPTRTADTDPITRIVTCSSDSGCAADTGTGATTYQCKTTVSPSLCCPVKASTCSNIGGRGNNHYTTALTVGDSGTGFFPVAFLVNPRWFWSTSLSRCVSFTYSGRGGNYNNFLSEQDCLAFCGTSVCTQGTPLKDQNGNNQQCSTGAGCPTTYECRATNCCPRPQTVCIQPKQPGTCANIAQRYWFNVNTRDCEVFDYSGCGGNDNNFVDYATCVSYCRDIKPQPRCIQGEAQKDGNGVYRTCSTSTSGICIVNFECYFDGANFGCCPTKATTCSSGRDVGRLCITTGGSRWWYNPTTRICDSFTYNGCDGNSNNFNTRDECERYCGASGCPYGGQPYTEPSTSSRRICSSAVGCPSGYECMNVLISNSPLNVCCLTRMTICSQNPIQGSELGTQTTRYYFNPSTRQCSTFTYFGTGGNENNFVNPAQCTNFCNSAACALGESVLIDPNSQSPVTCNQQLQNSCQAGYSCRQDTLFNRFVCCGSTDMGVCPSGEKAFVEPLTLQPRECTISATASQCSNNFLCRLNLQRNRNYCCISTTGGDICLLCPAGKAVLRDAVTQQPRSCFPSSVDQCQTNGYTCQPLTSGQSGYCCTNNAICPNNANFLVDANQNPRSCTIQVGINPCGTGATCQPASIGSTQGFCCQTGGVTDGCPAGQTILMVNGVVQTCGGINQAPFCPTSPTVYNCVLNSIVQPARFQCCGTTTTTTDPDGCGIGQIAFKENTGAYRICNVGQAGICPTGFGCQMTSLGQARCCGTSAGCPTNSVAQINPSTGQAQSCILGQACTSNAFQCTQASLGTICCSTGITEVTLPPTPQPAARCPFSNMTPYIAPGTASTVACNPRANTCPNSNPCLNNGQGFICCQPIGGGSQCPAGSTVAIGTNGQPQSCIGTTCGPNFRCQYSTTFRNYYCCSGGTVPSSGACPGTATAYFTPGSPTPARCTVGAQMGTIGACPPSYSCVNSPQFGTTICCTGAFASRSAADESSCSPMVYPNSNKVLSCESNPNGCPSPRTCRRISGYNHSVCC